MINKLIILNDYITTYIERSKTWKDFAEIVGNYI